MRFCIPSGFVRFRSVVCKMRVLLAAACTIGLAGPNSALDLQAPIGCSLGSECFVQQLPDRDAGSGHADFRCEHLTYDGHNGTDFGLPTLAAMRAGVDVLAAASGRVVAVRDEMPDQLLTADRHDDVEGRECGNGVVLRHGHGWTTQYCHMALGSVRVSPGDQVEDGEVLGRVGLSGKTQFPHLHFVVRHNRTIIDPFDGAPLDRACSSAAPDQSLWSSSAEIVAASGGLLSAGIFDRIPEYSEIWDDAPNRQRISAHTEAIVHWAHFFGLRDGDVIESELLAPDRTVLASSRHVMDRNRATEFRAAGRRRPDGGWAAGIYVGKWRLLRNGAVVAEASISTQIE